MKRIVYILLPMILLSSLYAKYVIAHPDFFSLSTFHIPLIFCDFLVIYLLKKKFDWSLEYGSINPPKLPFKTIEVESTPSITDILTVLLSLSIVTVGVGGIAWFFNSYGIKDVCDTLRPIVCTVELLVLAGGGYYHRIFKGFNSRSGGRNWTGNPGLYINNRNVDDG